MSSLESQVQDRLADAAAGVSGGATLVGVGIGTVNEYLQALAFVVAIISGLCAAYYYLKKSDS